MPRVARPHGQLGTAATPCRARSRCVVGEGRNDRGRRHDNRVDGLPLAPAPTHVDHPHRRASRRPPRPRRGARSRRASRWPVVVVLARLDVVLGWLRGGRCIGRRGRSAAVVTPCRAQAPARLGAVYIRLLRALLSPAWKVAIEAPRVALSAAGTPACAAARPAREGCHRAGAAGPSRRRRAAQGRWGEASQGAAARRPARGSWGSSRGRSRRRSAQATGRGATSRRVRSRALGRSEFSWGA